MSKSRRTISRSALALAVLLLLGESPMHPYQMHRMLRERRKEDVLDVRPAAIYRLVERLDGAGLIEPLGTSREGKRPERTVYRLTDEGRELSDEWLREMPASIRHSRQRSRWPACCLLTLSRRSSRGVPSRSRATWLAWTSSSAPFRTCWREFTCSRWSTPRRCCEPRWTGCKQ